jgi:hypothetical protein
MARKFDQNLDPLVPGQFFVKIAIRLFGFGGVGETLNRFLHAK